MNHIAQEEDVLKDILHQLEQERGFDFRRYNTRQLHKRVNKRMGIRKIDSMVEYHELLIRDVAECNALFDAITINATAFFRDQIAYDALREELRHRLSEGRLGQNGEIKVWSAACSTGQEPYSLAILLTELLREANMDCRINILATDIDPVALNKAALARYPRYLVEDIHHEWLRRYFRQDNREATLTDAIRHMIEFRKHNLLDPPPLADVDLILCRNVLIYFNIPTQVQVLRSLAHSVGSDGMLMLGRSELPVRQARMLWTAIDFPARLYRKRQMR